MNSSPPQTSNDCPSSIRETTTFPDPLRMTIRDSDLSYGDGAETSSRDTEISPPLRSPAANTLNCELLPRNSISPVASLRTSDSTISPITPEISTAKNLRAVSYQERLPQQLRRLRPPKSRRCSVPRLVWIA